MHLARAYGLVIGATLIGGTAVAQEAQERKPVGSETLTPVSVRRLPATAQAQASAAGVQRSRPRPLLTPAGPADGPDFMRAKDRAGGVRAQAADQALELGGVTAQGAASLTTSFHGIDILEAALIRGENGFIFWPSDANVAASNGRVVHVVNSAIRMFRRNGDVVQTLDLNDFFGVPVGSQFERAIFDPKIIYDANAANKRFYIVALETTAGLPPPNRSLIHLAVSRSPNPNNLNPANWCFYRINARRNAGTDLENWADFPSIGAGENTLVINTNQFSFTEGFFVNSVIRAIRKNSLANNATECPSPRLFTFVPSNQIGDFRTFTLQPVQQLTSPSSFSGTDKPMYLISSIFTAVTTVPTDEYRVYRLRNIATSPTLSSTTVRGSYDYFVPPNVGQENEFGFLVTNDDRVLEAAGVRNAFWAAQGTACSFKDSGNVSCARVIRVEVGQTAGGALRAAITQEKTFGAPHDFLFEPGIAVNKDETVVVPFQFVSPDRTGNNLSTWWVTKTRDEEDFRPLRPLATGTCQQVVERTGDYVGAETDPVDLTSFWIAGQRARRISGLGNDCFWETRIGRVTPGSSVAAQTP